MRKWVRQSALLDWIDPAELVAELFAAESNFVWLDSGLHAATGMSYLGFGNRTLTASVAENSVTVDGLSSNQTVFDFLRTDLGEIAIDQPTNKDGVEFQLGWVGWLGYELHAQTLALAASRRSRYSDASMLFVDRAIVFDHARALVSVIGLDAEVVDRLHSRLQERQHARVPGARRTPAPVEGEKLKRNAVAVWADTDEQYLRMIGACQTAILLGDAYQLCLTTEVQIAVTPDPLLTYLELRAANPSHHGAFFRAGPVSLLSSSPEVFLTVTAEGAIESQPIKGTRPRGQTEASDRALVAELLASEKERAENLMIVDLMRNDIGRVSTVGSVSVPRLLEVQSYARVHQLVSTVRGQIRAGVHPIEVLSACFPAGSMTGAPKLSAVSILGRLENRARGVYAGAFGYFGLDGRIELSMVIRSILLDASGATVGTGGGITALSVPAEELAEVKLKAAALLAVLGVTDHG